MSNPAALHDISAEAAVLGAVLFDSSILERIPQLDGAHFAQPAHAALWIEMNRLARAGQVVDAITVRPWWLAQEYAAELDGDRYLFNLLDRAARLTAHAIEYADLLRELANRRALHRLAQEALVALSRGEDASSVVSALEAGAMRVQAGRGNVGMSLIDAWRLVEAGLSAPFSASARFGLAPLDRTLGGLFASDLIILAGRPAMGKTSLATNIAVNAAKAGGVVHFASLEMEATQLAGRVGSRLTGAFAYADLRHTDRRPSLNAVRGAERVFPTGMWIDQTAAQTVAHLEAQARATAQRFGGLNLIVVDYLQLMTNPSARNASRVEDVSAITMGLKNLAKRLRVPVLALSQLSRAVETRDDKRPLLSDLRESGSIEQDADSVLFGYRDEYYLRQREPKPKDSESKADFDTRYNRWLDALDNSRGVMEVIIAKNRHGQVGSETLHFAPATDSVTTPEDRAA